MATLCGNPRESVKHWLACAAGSDIIRIIAQVMRPTAGYRLTLLQMEKFEDGIPRRRRCEQKIDDIARDVGGIKLLLQGRNQLSNEEQVESRTIWHPGQAESAEPPNEFHAMSAPVGESLWDHSVHIIGFIKAVLEDRGSKYARPEASKILSSLKKLLQALEDPALVRGLSNPQVKLVKHQAKPSMPPLEAVVNVLRWAKGFQDYRKYCQICRDNLQDALSRLPLLLPASMEVIAALAIGTYNAVENSRATVAWKYISAASDLCQTLGYHRTRPETDSDRSLHATQERLFWTVYMLEKGLSLRFGRSSSIRDAEITLPLNPDEPRSIKLARVNGLIYDQPYSPSGLSRPAEERGHAAEALGRDLRELINRTDGEPDPMRAIYLKCDLVCQNSLLALVFQAIPTTQDFRGEALGDCVSVARNALDIHEQCMKDVRDCKNDPFMVTKYINWAILYCPFVPFSIIFTRAVRLADTTDIARLDRFAESLQPEKNHQDANTHPYRLYTLLCEALRLYFDLDGPPQATDPNLSTDLMESLTDLDNVPSGIETGPAMDQDLINYDHQTFGLYDWSYDSQQIMGLLSDEMRF
ncbi:MAG: hypothetical protein M1820_005393 [Bogoriella megaspora]|nr:MAG: hypothetical protein M1820_005393 [Bogoriella megaspora]